MLPQSYPNYKTVHRRFQTWCRDEVLRRALTDIANELRDRGALDEEECFIDATFVMAKGGGAEIGLTKAWKRHENHGDSGSPRITALGQHARREPSRGPFGAALLRFLHDRSQATEFDRRPRLRQRSAGRRVATRRHQDDRTTPFQPNQAADARSTTVKPLTRDAGWSSVSLLGSSGSAASSSVGSTTPTTSSASSSSPALSSSSNDFEIGSTHFRCRLARFLGGSLGNLLRSDMADFGYRRMTRKTISTALWVFQEIASR